MCFCATSVQNQNPQIHSFLVRQVWFAFSASLVCSLANTPLADVCLRLDKLLGSVTLTGHVLSVERLFRALITAGRNKSMTFDCWTTLQKSKATDREVAGQVEV